MMYDNTEKLPRAILVGVDTGEYNAEISLLELEELAQEPLHHRALAKLLRLMAPLM